MGIIEFLTGWNKVGESEVNKKILSLLKFKANKIMERKIKRTSPIGRTFRGAKIYPKIYGCTVYITGRTFKYKFIQSSYDWIDNHGHGGFVSKGSEIYRKLK